MIDRFNHPPVDAVIAMGGRSRLSRTPKRVAPGSVRRAIRTISLRKALRRHGKTMATKTDLDTAERNALLRVQRTEGRRWRAALRKAWESGTLARLVGMTGPVAVLQRLRIKLGPSGLAKVRLDEDC